VGGGGGVGLNAWAGRWLSLLPPPPIRVKTVVPRKDDICYLFPMGTEASLSWKVLKDLTPLREKKFCIRPHAIY